MLTHREYVEGCLLWYKEADIQPGNPEDGEWHKCHYPTPKCLGGTHTILLLKEHHAVQGVLQSEEFQHPCIWSWEKQYLSGDFLKLWKKWAAIKAKPGLEVRHKQGWSQGSREKLSLAMSGENNPMHGKTRSSAFKENLSNKMKGRKLTEEHKKKLSENTKGNKNHMFGRKGKSNPMFGKKWWINAEGQTKLSHSCPGPGWQKGRTLP